MHRWLGGEPPYTGALPLQHSAMKTTAPCPLHYSQLHNPAIPERSAGDPDCLQYGDKTGLPHSPPYEAQWTCSAADPPPLHGQSESQGGGWCTQGVTLTCNINIVLIENISGHIL